MNTDLFLTLSRELASHKVKIFVGKKCETLLDFPLFTG